MLLSKRCNNRDDCGDNSDEQGCPSGEYNIIQYNITCTFCVREVSLTLVSFTHLILVYVVPPMRMCAWLMARVLRQRIE